MGIMIEDINEKGISKEPLWHEAYARREIVRQILERLEPFYNCPICRFKFNEKHELITHLMWLKDDEHTISALRILLELGGNKQRTDDISQLKVSDTTVESEAMKGYEQDVLEGIEKTKETE